MKYVNATLDVLVLLGVRVPMSPADAGAHRPSEPVMHGGWDPAQGMGGSW